MKMPDTPRLVFWELTKRCNLACKHCRADAGDVDCSGGLDLGRVKTIIGDIAEFASPILVLTGGEPLYRQDIFDIARCATDHGLRVALATNATLIDAACARRIRQAGIARTDDFFARGRDINILTVDNHADGVYLYLKLLKKDPARAEEVRRLLAWNGGGANSTGVGIGNIDFAGNVHPDQFWQDYTFGNIRERRFADIWLDQSDPIMKGLKNKAAYIKGRCRLCAHRDLCTGAMRVRARRTYGDPWAPDPQCYLTDAELGLDDEKKQELRSRGEDFPQPPELLA